MQGKRQNVLMYGGVKSDRPGHLRYVKYMQNAATSQKGAQQSFLPPTSAAANFHTFRAYYQIQEWKSLKSPMTLDPLDWGCEGVKGLLLPVLTDMPAAPEDLLKVVRCNCKTGCASTLCTCRKHGLVCTAACGRCRGKTCVNTAPLTVPDQEYKDDD